MYHSVCIKNDETKKLSKLCFVCRKSRKIHSQFAAIVDLGHKACFDKVGVEIVDKSGKTIGRGIRKGNLYELVALTASHRSSGHQ